MTIEKILLIGLAIAGVVAFTHFMDGGAARVQKGAETASGAMTNIENNGLKFTWK